MHRRCATKIITATSPTQFRFLATQRLMESQNLIRAKNWTGALYLAGYVVECSIKSRLASKNGGRLKPEHKIHDLDDLRVYVGPFVDDQTIQRLQAIPSWSHLIRYSPKAYDAVTAVRFWNRAKEASRCLLNQL